MSAVAVLLCSTPVTPSPARNAAKRLRSETPSKLAQIGAEGAHDAGPDHAHAPEQQRHRAEQLDQDAGRGARRQRFNPGHGRQPAPGPNKIPSWLDRAWSRDGFR